MNRRHFIGMAVALPALTTLGGWTLFSHAAATTAGFDNPLFMPRGEGVFGVLRPEGPLTFVAEQGWLPVPGRDGTPFLWYTTEARGRSFHNPVLHLRTGAELAVTLDNQLEEGTIIHWHGLHVPGSEDGHPAQTVSPGEQYEYRFQVRNRGGTYWYHTHAHHRTARQAHQGLASFLLVEDADTDALRDTLNLELGQTDLPLVLQDKRFDGQGRLAYRPNPMQGMMGYLGDEVLVNMTPSATRGVMRRVHRLRLLNGSNARIYRLALLYHEERVPFRVIGTDGGLLEEPREVSEAFLSPGERLEVLVDFADFDEGDTLVLHSLEFDAMMGSDMGRMQRRMMQGRGLQDGDAVALLQFVVQGGEAIRSEVPQRLSRIEPISLADARERDIRLDMAPMQWRIDGQTYHPEQVPIEVDVNTVEVWAIHNASHSMPHPMHIHGFSFQVLSRQGSPAPVREQGVFGGGRTVSDLGWKDTVLLWPGETVRIAIDFSHPYTGNQLYVFHCHNLEHEDNDMMVNVRVRA